MKLWKTIVVCVMSAFAALPASGGNKSIYLELLGPSTFAGVWFDVRIAGARGLGVGAGFSAVPSQTDDVGRWTAGTWSAGLPLALNYLCSSGPGYLEIGLGVHNAIMKKEDHRLHWGYYCFMNIGYRYQSSGGFVFRVGLSPSWQRSDSHSIIKRKFYPYLAFGWAF